MKEWMEPAFEVRTIEVTEICENETAHYTESINELLKDIQELLPTNRKSLVIKLEDAFIQSNVKYASIAYKYGFSDALDLVGK